MQGRCPCGDTSRGFTTYTFLVEGVQRCFTVYQPQSRLNEVLPVVITSQCYGQDRLSSIGMTNDRSTQNQAAARYGYARIGISTPDGKWEFGNNGIVNDSIPMPCSEKDSKDIIYLTVILDWISNSQSFDDSNIYAEGFSQNSMFSAYLGFCFSNQVAGIWQGGSGMALTGVPPTLPASQAQCTASSFAEYGRDCVDEDPCTTCQYWPVYPCYQPQRAMKHCIVEYDNDFISSGRENPEVESSGKYMYNASTDEGNNAVFLRFSPSDDGSIAGSHQDPKNTVFWQIGCWGMTQACSTECEASFQSCIESENAATALERTSSFATCIGESSMASLVGCTTTCSPTLNMMKLSEDPTTLWNGGFFGETSSDARPRPTTSLCTAFDD